MILVEPLNSHLLRDLNGYSAFFAALACNEYSTDSKPNNRMGSNALNKACMTIVAMA